MPNHEKSKSKADDIIQPRNQNFKEFHKSLSDPYQSRYNSIPLVGLRGIRTNHFNNTLLSMSNWFDISVQCFTINVKLDSIYLYNALLSMSNWTRSICTVLYYQCQTGLDVSLQCFTINVKLDSIYLYNALLSMSNWTRYICTMLYYQC